MLRETGTNRGLVADELARVATGRSTDLFEDDLAVTKPKFVISFEGRRVLVLGGAGSIGSPQLNCCLKPSESLHVVDQNENALAELVRDLRSRPEGLSVPDFGPCPWILVRP